MIYRQPADLTRGPNCGVVSVAVLSCVTQDYVMQSMRRICGYNSNWKGSSRIPRYRDETGKFRFDTAKGDCFKVLAHCGMSPVAETGLEDRHANRQLQNVVAELPTDRAYLICTGGHAQAVVDGRVFDQSTSPDGDPVATYWGRTKKVNSIISVDRLDNSDKENEPMPALTVVPTDVPDADMPAFVAIVADYEAAAASSVTAIKGLTGEKNEAKIKGYANTIAGLVAHKVRSGTRRAGEIKAGMVAQGISKACAKRYTENGQKAKALPWIKAAGSDVDAILAAFAENDVKTEQDLVNIVSPKVEQTAAEVLAAKAKALTDTDEDAVQALLDAAVLINPGCADVAATLVATLARLDLAA